jgi:tagaturonate epimerase
MTEVVSLPKYSLGVGDRFAHQTRAQLEACEKALENGVEVIPVWNKSNREHTIIGSNPAETRAAADEAVKTLGWSKPYFVDADHINLSTVDRYIDSCDFYTIDVADWIGKRAEESSVQDFAKRHPELVGEVRVDGLEGPLRIEREFVVEVANKYLAAVRVRSVALTLSRT